MVMYIEAHHETAFFVLFCIWYDTRLSVIFHFMVLRFSFLFWDTMQRSSCIRKGKELQ